MKTRRVATLLAVLAVLAAGTAVAAERDDLAARMAKAENASEYWDLMARFESGHRLVARFQVTNEGPGRHTAVAVGHLVFPDGSHADFHNGRTRARWKLDDARLRLDIGSSTLDLRGPTRAYEVDKNKAGVKIHLSIEASDATSLASGRGPGGYRVRLVDLAAPIEGSVWIRDHGMPEPVSVRGLASLTHTWMDESEPEVALRRIDFASLDDDTAVSLIDLTTPGGPPLRWIAIQREGRIVYESADFEVSLEGAAARSSRGYPVPGRLRFRNSELDGTIELGRIVLKKNPMTVLPQPFRFLLSLKMKPRRFWADSPFELKFAPPTDRSGFQARGKGLASVTFLNPLQSS